MAEEHNVFPANLRHCVFFHDFGGAARSASGRFVEHNIITCVSITALPAESSEPCLTVPLVCCTGR